MKRVNDVSGLLGVASVELHGAESLGDITPLCRARHVDLTDCKAIVNFTPLSAAQTVVLAGTEIEDPGILAAASMLDLSGCDYIPHDKLRAIAKVPRLDNCTLYTLARLFEQDGDVDAAIVTCRRGSRPGPGPVTEILLRRQLAYAKLMANAGWLLHNNKGDVEAAESAYRAVISVDGRNATALAGLGWLLHDARHDYMGAEALYRRALECAPEDVATLCNLGFLLRRERRDVDGAERLYRQALNIDPEHADTNSNLGFLLFIERDLEVEARVHLRRSLATDPNHLRSLYNLGWLRCRDLDYVGGEKLLRRAVGVVPTDTGVLAILGWVVASRPDPDFVEADSLFCRALAIEPEHAGVLCFSALMLMRRDGASDVSRQLYYQASSALEKANHVGHFVERQLERLKGYAWGRNPPPWTKGGTLTC